VLITNHTNNCRNDTGTTDTSYDSSRLTTSDGESAIIEDTYYYHKQQLKEIRQHKHHHLHVPTTSTRPPIGGVRVLPTDSASKHTMHMSTTIPVKQHTEIYHQRPVSNSPPRRQTRAAISELVDEYLSDGGMKMTTFDSDTTPIATPAAGPSQSDIDKAVNAAIRSTRQPIIEMPTDTSQESLHRYRRT
jgi:hypothetical protein